MEKNLTQGSSEWLAFKKNTLGGSDAPVVMQVSPWKSPFSLWQEKLSLIPPQPKTAAMQRGLDLEGEARLLFTIESGIHVEPKVFVSDEYFWMIASMDGVSADNSLAIEIKCVGLEDHDKAVNGRVPEKYVPQLQHQMKVLELDSMIYVSYFNEELTFFEVKRDEQYIKGLVEIELEFYDCMTTMTPPKMLAKDYIPRNDQECLLKVQERKRINQAQKELDEQEKVNREALIKLAGDNNIICDGVKIAKQSRKGAIQYDAIPELENIDLEKYRKQPSEYWKIT